MQERKQKKSRQLAYAGVLLLAVAMATYALWPVFNKNFASEPAAESAIQQQAQVASAPPEPVVDVHDGMVEKGDTASSILNTWLGTKDIYSLDRACNSVYSLAKIRRGQPYRVVTEDGDFDRFEYEIDDESCLVVERKGNEFDVNRVPIEYDTKVVRVSGSIESSLYGAVGTAGEYPALAVMLADIFGWEIDFIRDIRTGDDFTVLVEKRYRDGEFKSYGNVIAANFTNQGDRYEGFLFPDKDGRIQYYTADGENLRRAFLKAPLSFKRISSNFTSKRLHPVLKVYRPHYGVDYAAPTGTPVHVVGDGKVIAVTRTKAAGKYIKVRHKNGYESAYLHLSRFGKGMRKGTNVRQGQVIGYVGSTGYATGPHLDFRMKRHGQYLNPRKAINPRSNPITKDRLTEFQERISVLQAQLDSYIAAKENKADNAS